MRVIHIFAGDLKSVSEGGIATYIRELIKKQIENGIDVSLVGVTGNLQDNIGKWNEQKIGNKSFFFLPLFYTSKPHFTYKRGIPLNVKFLWALLRNKRKFLFKDCILHIHRVELALPFLIYKKSFPIILTLHGGGNRDQIIKEHPLFKKAWFKFLFWKIEEFVIKRAQQIILVTHEAMDYYDRRFVKERKKFIFIPTFVDTEQFRPMDKNSLRMKYNFLPNDKILLFVGRFAKEKGLGLLVDTFKKVKEDVPDSKLVLVGDGEEKEYLQNKVKKMNIDGIEFKGMIEHDKLPEIINCADVFVLTSLWEGLPIAILEALSCGLPIVSTDLGQFNELVKENISGFIVKDRNPDNVKIKIIEAISMSSSMKENCRKIVQSYSSANIVPQILDVYRNFEPEKRN